MASWTVCGRNQDSHGGGGTILDGGTQYMTAGDGILHIETPPEHLVMSGGTFHGVQLWINLPKDKKRILRNMPPREQFAASHDPYGRPWAKLAPATVRKKGHDRILIDTGETAATIQAVPWGSRSVAGVRIRTMGWHQYPTAHRPARPILPTGPLPPRWAAAARDALREARDRAIKGT